MFMCVLFYLGQLSHFLSCFGAGVTNLNEPLRVFLLPPHYCGLGAGSPNKQCEMRGLFMSLVIRYWIGDVQDCQGVSASTMTYTVSSGALNSTHSLTLWLKTCELVAAADRRQLRSSDIATFVFPHTYTHLGDRAFPVAGPWLWNGLPSNLRQSDLTLQQFRRALKTHLIAILRLQHLVTFC